MTNPVYKLNDRQTDNSWRLEFYDYLDRSFDKLEKEVPMNSLDDISREIFN